MNKIRPVYLISIFIIGILFYFKSELKNFVKLSNIKLPPEHLTSELPKKYADLIRQKPDRYLIENVNVIPMNKDTVLLNQNVYVENGIITGIKKELPDLLNNEEVKKINAEGKYLIPGLTDMHIHLNDDNQLLLMIVNGITTVRNMNGFPFHLKLREQIKNDEILGPELYTSSRVVEGKNRLWPNSISIVNSKDIESLLKNVQSEGYDFIKVYHNISDTNYVNLNERAESYGLKLVGHLPLETGLEGMLKLNQYSIEHIDLDHLRKLSPAISLEKKAEQIGKSGKWICPTLVVHRNIQQGINDSQKKEFHKKFVDEDTKGFWDRGLGNGDGEYELQKKLLKIMYENGGRITSGTDCLNTYVLAGFSLHEELQELVKAGLSEYEVLKTSTYNSAVYFNQLEKSGTVQKGKNANLLLLNENPLIDIKNTQNIYGVFIKGKWISKKEINNVFEEVKKQYE